MTLSKYRKIDITVLCVIAIIFEIVNYCATTYIPDFHMIYLSFTIVLTLIAMERWGAYGVIIAPIGGLTACIVASFAGDVEISQYLSYIIGNSSVIMTYLIFDKCWGKEKLKKNYPLLICYLLSSFVSVMLFRSIILFIFNEDFLLSLRREVVWESMSFVISIIIILIANRKNGIFVYMPKYIKELQMTDKLHIKDIVESDKFNDCNPLTKPNEIDYSNLLDGGMPNKEELDQIDDYEKTMIEKEKK